MTRQVLTKIMTNPLTPRMPLPSGVIRWVLVFAIVSASSMAVAQPKAGAGDEEAVRAYLDAITQAEAVGGAYAAELGDLYVGLGQSLVEVGDLEEAREAFQQGVMVARVNFGPNSIEQSNYLFSIADIETRIGDLEAAADVLQTIYLVNAKNYGEDNPAMLPALERMFAWYFDPETAKSAPQNYSDFKNGSFLARRVAYLTEVENGLGNPKTAMSYRALGQLQFEAIRYISATGEALASELDSSTDWTDDRRIQEKYLYNHFRDGAYAFERASESWQENPEASELERAEAMAQAGDWFLVFSKPDSAQRYYQQAYDLLAKSSADSTLADGYLGKPTPLRILNNHEPFVRELDAPHPEGGLVLSMTVTRTGDLQDIEVLNAIEGEPPDVLRDVKRQMRSTRFRPGLINGKMEKMEGFIYQIPLVKSGEAE